MQYQYTETAPGLPLWFWLLAGGIGVGLPAIGILAALLLRARAARAALSHLGQLAGPARAHVRRVTWCGLGGLGVGALVGLELVSRRQGWPAILACAGGYLGGVLVGEYVAQPPVAGPVRAALLQPRRPADYVPRWAALAALLSGALVLAAPVAFSVASPISYPGCPADNVCESFTGGPVPGGQTSWPGWPGTVAGALLTSAALLVATAGLRRLAARPAPADGAEQAVDNLLRHQAGRAIAGAVLGLQLLVLAALLLFGSHGLEAPDPATAPGAYLGSRVMVFAGLGCAVAGVVSWLVLSGSTRRPVLPPAPPPDQAAMTPGF